MIVGKGGRVRGDALSVGGTVRLDGGTVDGELRTLSAFTVGPATKPPLTPAMAMRHSVTLAVGWYLVLACVGLGVLLVARVPLDAVSEALRAQPVRALGVGVLAQLAVAPAFVLVIVALAITIIGAVVIPFAIIGFFAALAGALALGFIAVVMNTGGAILSERNGDRSLVAALQPLLLGLSGLPRALDRRQRLRVDGRPRHRPPDRIRRDHLGRAHRRLRRRDPHPRRHARRTTSTRSSPRRRPPSTNGRRRRP